MKMKKNNQNDNKQTNKQTKQETIIEHLVCEKKERNGGTKCEQ